MRKDLDLAENYPAGVTVAPAAGSLDSGWVPAIGTKLHCVIAVDATDEDITITPNQATAAAGTGAKALNVHRVHVKTGTATVFTRTDVGAATYVYQPGANKGLLIVECDIAEMDVNNGFNHVRFALTGSTGRVQSIVVLPAGT